MKTTAYPILAAALLLGACTSGPYTPKEDAVNSAAANSPVILLDKDLRRTLDIDHPTMSTRDSTGRLIVQASLRNRTNDEELHIQVQTLFFDRNGFPLYAQTGSEPPWQNFRLTPNQSIPYTQTALTPQAERYTIRVRYSARTQNDD